MTDIFCDASDFRSLDVEWRQRAKNRRQKHVRDVQRVLDNTSLGQGIWRSYAPHSPPTLHSGITRTTAKRQPNLERLYVGKNKKSFRREISDRSVTTKGRPLASAPDEPETTEDATVRLEDIPTAAEIALHSAVDAALQKFERKELETLVRKEYEVVDAEDTLEEYILV